MDAFDKQFNTIMEDVHISTSLNILNEEEDLKSLQNLLSSAEQEDENSAFFKNRGSKKQYIKMLTTKIEKLKA